MHRIENEIISIVKLKPVCCLLHVLPSFSGVICSTHLLQARQPSRLSRTVNSNCQSILLPTENQRNFITNSYQVSIHGMKRAILVGIQSCLASFNVLETIPVQPATTLTVFKLEARIHICTCSIKKNYIMPTSFCKQVVFNCHINSALANYFWKESVFCETQDDIWSSAIKEIWLNWGILYMIWYEVCLWVRKHDFTNFGIKLSGYRVHHSIYTGGFHCMLNSRLSASGFRVIFIP